MTKEEEQILHRFETRVRQLILQHKELRLENSRLQAVLAEKERALTESKEDYERLEANYANLKLAKMLEINDTDMKNAKSRLAKLIREIDKCIALLNV